MLPDGQLPPAIEYEDSEILGAFITIDPAGRKKKSDANVIAAHLLLTDTRIVIAEIGVLQGQAADPQSVIKAAIDMAIRYNASVIFPEAVVLSGNPSFLA